MGCTLRPTSERIRKDAENRKKSGSAVPSTTTTPPMSAFVLNITFDCHEPLTLARFWADATGYRPDGEPARGTARIRLTNPDPRGVKHLVFRRVPDAGLANRRRQTLGGDAWASHPAGGAGAA